MELNLGLVGREVGQEDSQTQNRDDGGDVAIGGRDLVEDARSTSSGSITGSGLLNLAWEGGGGDAHGTDQQNGREDVEEN